jgi:hypothetical protein
MKKSNKNSNISCAEIERLLIKKNIEGLTDSEQLLLNEHLKYCGRCIQFQRALVNIKGSMEIKTDNGLLPYHAVRQNLIKRMESIKKEKQSMLNTFLQPVRNILEYRIPVYQAAIGIAVVLLISIVNIKMPFSSQKKPLNLQDAFAIEDSISYQYNFINKLQIIDSQKIGINVKEDTMFTKYIVTSM